IVEARILSDEPCTLEALGREMGVSKERVRQLEVRARQKLRDRLEHLRPAA
ncbi:MAG: RNA polymerase subunit sigma-70, partial [Myxococcales bacterium]